MFDYLSLAPFLGMDGRERTKPPPSATPSLFSDNHDCYKQRLSAHSSSVMLTRRAFGQAALAFLAAASGRAEPARAVEPLMDVAIAGGRYHALKDRRAALPLGRLLRLAREPENPFDPNAVAILDTDGARLGYVPRAAAGRVAALLDAGEAVAAEIVGTLPVDLVAMSAHVVTTDPVPGDPRIRLSRLA
ncbi:HIRAN domain-containing protein [Aurantimonas sp. MSK8Z-1]|uniref:HIRAN domain-containing protein n=1 Tax=Mangrovibrevibacter kandeliae TaxID=2968473 RepID=UPI00222E5235|nr:HIRAN domain-containing protein [Aurantimonas sp. MSK8Z-1]MCW4116880.1 HIRAN domain-containing protein [Aurantimonas sp. MSK8Z-1]